MRVAAALLLASAAVDWPALVLDRAGVALLGLAALALALPAGPRRPSPFAGRPRGAELAEALGPVEPELAAAAARAVASIDNGRRAS